MARRTVDQYDFSTLKFDEQFLTDIKGYPARSSARTEKIQFVVVHHMTIIGKGTGSALDSCVATWKSREASAHYGVDGERVGHFVQDERAAWATANHHGNHAGISVEHANSAAGPKWTIADATLSTSARLVANLHVVHKLGRPVSKKTLFWHQDFYATACPGPYFTSSAVWKAYVADVQRIYDEVVAGKPSAPVVPTWGQPATWRVGGVSADVKRLAERLVVHGFESFYGNGTDTTFTAGEDQAAVKAFQESQGWSGSDADGFPGMQTFALLEADPVAATPDPTPAVKPALRAARAAGAAPAKMPSSMSKMYHVASNVWYAPGDSIYGLEAAEAGGYPWADIDIHVTKDGVMVCGHDTSPSDDHFVISATLKKKYGSHPNIENMTWADVSTLRTPPVKFGGKTITLRYYKVDEILAWMGEHLKVSVSLEMKQSKAFENPKTFEALRDMAVAHGVDPKRLAIMSIARPAYDHLARFKAAHAYFKTIVLPHDLAKPKNWAAVQPYVDYYRGSWA